MSTHPFRRGGAFAIVLGLVLAGLTASPRSASSTDTQRALSEPLITEYQLGNMEFSEVYTVVTTSDIELHFHESGRSIDQLFGGVNRSNCNDQRCPPVASKFRLEMFDPTGKPLGQAWGVSSSAEAILGPEPTEFDFDITWQRRGAGRYRLIVGYGGLGNFERYIDVK
jgi:hypothetical protein